MVSLLACAMPSIAAAMAASGPWRHKSAVKAGSDRICSDKNGLLPNTVSSRAAPAPSASISGTIPAPQRSLRSRQRSR
jgi:hypothetical protein